MSAIFLHGASSRAFMEHEDLKTKTSYRACARAGQPDAFGTSSCTANEEATIGTVGRAPGHRMRNGRRVCLHQIKPPEDARGTRG